jgi:hypothetical protein
MLVNLSCRKHPHALNGKQPLMALLCSARLLRGERGGPRSWPVTQTEGHSDRTRRSLT